MSRCVLAQIVEYLIFKLRDCKVFFKLDLKQGYHKLKLQARLQEFLLGGA